MPDVKPTIEKPKTQQELAQDFMNEYTELCEKHGFQITVTPAYKVSQDTGTWSTVLQVAVGKISKKDEQLPREQK